MQLHRVVARPQTLHRVGIDTAKWLSSSSGQVSALVVGVVALAAQGVYLARIPPATGYETSITAAYPPAFWLLFVTVLAVVISVFIGSAMAGTGLWRHGFALLAANYGIYFFLPAHRGYRLYDRGSADSLAHLGSVKSMVAEGTLSTFYPFEHLVLAQLNMSGVPLPLARYAFELALTLLFIGSVGVLVRELTGDQSGLPIGLCAATPLVFMHFQLRIHPAVLSFLLVPLVLYLLFASHHRDSRWLRSLAVAFAVGVVFFHPMTAGFLFLMVVSTSMFTRLYGRVGTDVAPRLVTNLPSIVLLIGFLWYIDLERTQRAIGQIVEGVLVGGQAPVEQQTQLIQAADLTTAQIGLRFAQNYGALVLYALIASLFLAVILAGAIRGRRRFSETYIASQFVIGGAVAVVFLTTDLIARAPIRVARYLGVMAVLLVALLLYRMAGPRIDRTSARTVLVLVLGLAVLSTAVVGTIGGNTYWPNQHMTHKEYQGAEFILDHQDRDVLVHSQYLDEKMQWFVTGDRSRPNEPPVFRYPDSEFRLLPGLGYPEHDTAASAYGRSYLVTQEYDRQFYRSSYFTDRQQADLRVYGEGDLSRLDRDPTAAKVYTSEGFETWFVLPAAPSARASSG